MRCLNPRTVGFQADGKTICWSQKSYSKEFASFQLPCGKCIECRLEYARTWAIRCVHEASMYEDNSFITLTYSDENLVNPKLNYEDFQLFMKRLRKRTSQTVGMFVTGEYGEKNKRPHWHAIVFNWRPADCIYQYTTDNADRVYSSKTLGPFTPDEVSDCKSWDRQPLWPFGKCEIGQVTFKSAGYVARYAAKKLVHKDQVDDYQPISKKSSKQAIGKKFLESYYKDIFNYGECRIDGQSMAIPRYYIKWLEKNHPDDWVKFVTETKLKKEAFAREKALREQEEYFTAQDKKHDSGRRGNLITRQEVKKLVINDRFKRLMSHLKGDL